MLRLKENYALRGWHGLPYGILDTNTGHTIFLDAVTFQAAGFCTGEFDLNLPIVLPIHREAMKKLMDDGIVEACSDGATIQEWQKYRSSRGRYAASAHWSITGRCNLRCRHCYLSAPEAKYGELSTAECLQIIDQIEAAGIGSVSLTGGEPLVRRDFWQLISDLRQKRIVIRQIYTNGVLITDEWLARLQQAGVGCSFSLSFDGVGCHDWLRGVPGTENKVVESIRKIRAHGFDVSIETALYNGNLPQMRETFDLLVALGVSAWKLSPVMNVGNWQREQGIYDVSLETLYREYLELARLHRQKGAPLNLILGGFFCGKRGSTDYYIPFCKFDGTEAATKQIVCRSCRIHPYIMADGKLLPCIPMTGSPVEAEMSSLFEISLEQALYESLYFDRIDLRVGEVLQHNPTCAKCEHRLRCGGGCRACSMEVNGDYYAVDPYCCYFFQHGYEQKLHECLKTADAAV
jgi:radical SAM protein with 4Fe4S-binding SPASM domain